MDQTNNNFNLPNFQLNNLLERSHSHLENTQNLCRRR